MLQLDRNDRAMLDGDHGAGTQMAMRLLVALGESMGASRLIDIEWAHLASAYYQSQANFDFARRLLESETTVRVPTTLTSCGTNMLGDEQTMDRELIETYKALGADPVMSCAPYHCRDEPSFGSHLAWCESSAVVFANSVLGARTNRYVEFIDMCAAITGRVPEYGLHLDDQRCATVAVNVSEMPSDWYEDAWMFHLLGLWIGANLGDAIPVIIGLPPSTNREQLRALGAAAASAGSISMFHAIGLTPEAETFEQATGGNEPERTVAVSAQNIRDTADLITTGSGKRVTSVCAGAPHFSVAEFADLVRLLDGRRVRNGVTFIVATSPVVHAQLAASGQLQALLESGVEIVTGRCTYYKPEVSALGDHVMTNSAKWAWYAPNALEIHVTFASLADCVAEACGRE